MTTVLRTLCDLAADRRITDRELERAFDFAITRRMTSRTQVRERLDGARHRGVRRLRRLLPADRTTTRTRSENEERLLALCRKAQLPAPETNAPFERYEIDFLWRSERLAVEVDGFPFHSDRATFERDRRKDNELRTLGLTVIRITADQLADEPELVLAWIVAALARAA